MKLPLTVATLFCSLALAAVADQPLPKERQQEIFNGVDTNHDHAVSFEEFKSAMAGNISAVRMENVFREKDRNHDGHLNVEEFFYVVQDQRTDAPEKKSPDRQHQDK